MPAGETIVVVDVEGGCVSGRSDDSLFSEEMGCSEESDDESELEVDHLHRVFTCLLNVAVNLSQTPVVFFSNVPPNSTLQLFCV